MFTFLPLYGIIIIVWLYLTYHILGGNIKMIKLVASDLDGTIIGRDNNIAQTNLKAINDINNKHVIKSTYSILT